MLQLVDTPTQTPIQLGFSFEPKPARCYGLNSRPDGSGEWLLPYCSFSTVIEIEQHTLGGWVIAFEQVA